MEKPSSCIFYKDKINIQKMVKNIQKENADAFEEPFYICDLSEVINNYNNWRKYMPRITPFYAVKCNNYTPILETLANVGASFDCASKNEIKKIISLGVGTDRIVYANPTKQISNIKYARDVGVLRIVFDNELELHKVHEIYPDAELVLRIRCDSKSAIVSFGEKFGCDVNNEAFGLLKLSKRLNLKVVGVSFHVGSICQNPASYVKAIASSKKIFDAAESIGIKLNLLDIGGGFLRGISDLIKTANIINKCLDKYFPNDDLKVIAEPGNYLVSTSMTLITKIHSIRESQLDEGIRKMMYYINAGVFNAFCFCIHGEYPTKPDCLEVDDPKLVDCSIWGPTCDSFDKIIDNIRLPKQDIDDILIFRNMGAYTVSIASTFNGFPIPPIQNYLKSEHKYYSKMLVKLN